MRDRTDVLDVNHADNDMSFRPRWYLSERVDVCVLGYREIVKKAGLNSAFAFFIFWRTKTRGWKLLARPNHRWAWFVSWSEQCGILLTNEFMNDDTSVQITVSIF